MIIFVVFLSGGSLILSILFLQGPADYKVGQTKYGVNNFPEDRPPIEKWWAEYQAEQKANAAPSHH